MADGFKREDRYVVLKRADLERHATPSQLRELERICEMIRAGRANEGKRLNSYVVVADDWPEYEGTWVKIQARTDLNSSLWAEAEAKGIDPWEAAEWVAQQERERGTV